MAFRIPEQKIEEVRAASDIVDVVSAYLTLKKRGKNFFGLCPFHTEKTPSFSVNPQMQIYRCFGCNAGGNVFTFLMRMEGITFPEAVRHLAQRAGIQIPEEHVDEQETREKETLLYANRMAAEFYYRSLTSSSQGRKALQYLQERGLDTEKLGSFGLGYALDSWDGLINYAQSKKMVVETLVKTGLALRKESGGYYDRFRDRVMFPVFDVMGRIVGFGGRRLKDDDTPKYINSPETAVYKKSFVLYGLYQAKESIREQDVAILVEGYTDLLSLFQRGIKNVVATSGTAFTEEQAGVLRRYTQNVIVLYDADSAGSSAAIRGADILTQRGLDVRVSRLPSGSDPDSFVREKGVPALTSLLDASESLIDFKINVLREAGFFETPEKKARAVRSVLESIAVIPDEIKRNLVAQEAADSLGLDERLLMGELAKLRQSTRLPRTTAKPASRSETLPVDKPSKADVAEQTLLRLMVADQSVTTLVLQHLKVDEFRNTGIRDMVRAMVNALDKGETLDPTTPPSFQRDPVVAQTVVAALSDREAETGVNDRQERDQVVRDCILAVKKRPLEEKSEMLRKRIKELQAAKKTTSSVMQEYQSVVDNIKQLDSYWSDQKSS